MNRRDFLKWTAVTAGAVAAFGAGIANGMRAADPASPPASDHLAMAMPPPQGAGATQTFVYKGRTVDIDETATTVVVKVNGTPLMGLKKLGAGRYAAHFFPFRDFADIVTLVKALIDGHDQQLFLLY